MTSSRVDRLQFLFATNGHLRPVCHVASADQIKSVRFKNLRRPDRKSPGFHGRKPSQPPRISHHGCNRTRSGNRTRRGGHLAEFASMRPSMKNSLPARCHAPRTARLAGSGHMNGCDLETDQALPPIGLIGRRNASHRPQRPCRGLVQRPRDAHIEAMCGWSMSLTRFGVAKLRAAVRAMLKQYDGAGIQMATQCSITSLAGSLRKQIAILLAIRQIVAICRISPRAPGCYR